MINITILTITANKSSDSENKLFGISLDLLLVIFKKQDTKYRRQQH